MPLYEYRCRSCGTTSDHLRPAGRADDPVVCRCGGADVVRLPARVTLPRRSASLPMGGGGCCGGGACGCAP